MSATKLLRRKPAVPTYEVLQHLQHWRRVGGHWYRDAVARRSDGQLRLISVPDRGVL